MEIAWAAGLFEGEGSIQLWREGKSDRLYPRLDLASTDEDVVRRFSNAVGTGRVYGPYSRPNRKTFWRCLLHGQDARHALDLIGPWLGERRAARMQQVLEQSDVPARHRKEQ